MNIVSLLFSRPIPILFTSESRTFPGKSSASSDISFCIDWEYYTIWRDKRLEDLAREFGVAEDVMGGMQYLDSMIRESDDFKRLVD